MSKAQSIKYEDGEELGSCRRSGARLKNKEEKSRAIHQSASQGSGN